MFGNDQLVAADVDPSEWVYEVIVANGSNVTFEEVVIVYSRKSVAGSIFLSRLDLPPGYMFLFYLCECSDLEGYVLGLFWRDANGQLVSGSVPATGFYPPSPCANTPDVFEIPPDFAGTWV